MVFTCDHGPMNTIKGFIFDLDGTLYMNDQLLPGAADLLCKLKEKKIPYVFVTNTTSKSVSEILEHLATMGIGATARDLITPVDILTTYLQRRGVRRISIEESHALHNSFPDFEITDDPEVIILAEGGSGLDYTVVNRVMNCALNGAEVVALIRNKYYAREDGLVADLGFYVAGFEYVLGKKIPVFGKPSRPMFTAAMKRLRIGEPSTVAVVGDDIEFDVLGAQEHGFQGYLVRTGKYRSSIEEQYSLKPTRIIDGVSSLLDEF